MLETINNGDVFYCEIQQNVEATFRVNPKELYFNERLKSFKFQVNDGTIKFGERKLSIVDIYPITFWGYDKSFLTATASNGIGSLAFDNKPKRKTFVHTTTYGIGGSLLLAYCEKF